MEKLMLALLIYVLYVLRRVHHQRYSKVQEMMTKCYQFKSYFLLIQHPNFWFIYV